MSYTVLARRFRSQTFDDVVGQDTVAQTLKNAIKTDRVAHAYLFCGTRGVGKTTMARILAKSLNCLNSEGPTPNPCLKCDSCISINTGEDIDVIEIDGASNTGVDNIRQLRENAAYRPARARYKIYIIDEVHMLSTGAFNALLKILEEPPAHIKFIFATTDPHKVLPTIQSRCQRFDFAAISPDVIARQLSEILKQEGIAFEQDFLMQLARLANGSMRDALSLLDQLISVGTQPLTLAMLEQLLGRPGAEHLAAIVKSIGSADPAGTLASIETLIMMGQTPLQVAEYLIELFRDVMVLKTVGANSDILLLSGVSKSLLSELAGGYDVPWLVYAITAMERLRYTLKNSETARALLEATLLRLAMSEHFLSLDALAGQLRGGAVSQPAASFDIKKKPIALTGSPAAPAAPHKSDPGMPAISPGSLTADSIRSVWPQFVEDMQAQQGQLGSFLAQARLGDLRNGTLTLIFNDNGSGLLAVDFCRKRNELVESALKQTFGQSVAVKYELTKNPVQTAAVSEKPAPSAAPAAAPGARINRQQEQEVLSDPAVKLILTGLSARASQIERIESDEQDLDAEEQS